jgi:hypothetical protein
MRSKSLSLLAVLLTAATLVSTAFAQTQKSGSGGAVVSGRACQVFTVNTQRVSSNTTRLCPSHRHFPRRPQIHNH